MKKLFALLLSAALVLSLSACGDVEIKSAPEQTPASSAEPAAVESQVIENTVVEIVLSGNSVSCEGRGVSVSGSTITIGASGDYVVSGTLNDGQIIVNTGEDALNVNLTLNGADITCLNDSAIVVQQAKRLHLILAEDTENTVTSGTALTVADDTASGAAIHSSDDLRISGEGVLNVNGYINNGIASKNDIKIQGGNIHVVASNNGIRAGESVTIENGTISVEANNDGIKAASAAKAGKGFVLIEDGSITVNSAGDGISAASELTVNGGMLSITTTGNTALISSKAMKAVNSLTINGGTMDLTTTGKAVSCPGSIFVNDGILNISAKDDGIASDTELNLNGGTVTIISYNDGLKAGVKGGTVGNVSISGGIITISAAVDPIDAKGALQLSGGQLSASGNSKGLKHLTSSIPVVTFAYSTQCAKGVEAVVTNADSSYSYAFSPMFGYKLIVLAGGDLVSGTAYTAVSGSTSASATAN